MTTTNTNGSVEQIFDKEKIQAGFEIVGQFINQVNTLVTNKAREADDLREKAKDPNGQYTQEQRDAMLAEAAQIDGIWGPKGSGRQVLTALSVAAGGNVTGGAAQFAQNATIAYVQQLGAAQVKDWADSMKSESARAALHAIVGCAGAAASSQSCGAGALGASASSLIGSMLESTNGMTTEERQFREHLVTSLVASIASAAGSDVVTATQAGQIEVENNQVGIPMPPPATAICYSGQTWGAVGPVQIAAIGWQVEGQG